MQSLRAKEGPFPPGSTRLQTPGPFSHRWLSVRRASTGTCHQNKGHCCSEPPFAGKMTAMLTRAPHPPKKEQRGVFTERCNILSPLSRGPKAPRAVLSLSPALPQRTPQNQELTITIADLSTRKALIAHRQSRSLTACFVIYSNVNRNSSSLSDLAPLIYSGFTQGE